MLLCMESERSQRRKKEIAAKIKQARERSGLSQEGLGGKMSPPVVGATISNYERAVSSVDVPTLEEIARVLEQPLQFFTGQAAPRRDNEAEALGRAVLKLVQEHQNVTRQPWRAGGAGFRTFPIINTVPADDASVRDSQLEDEIDIPDTFWIGASNPQVYRVSGGCMVMSGIVNGDTVIIDADKKEPSEGQVVLAQVNGGLTLKRFFRVSNHVELRPNAPGYETIVVTASDELIIVGCFHRVYDTGKR